MCPFGTYQPQDGQYICKPCGPQKSTKFPASKSNQDCVGKLCNKTIFGLKIKFLILSPSFFIKIEFCGPGTYSYDGLFPCTTCKIGYYQDQNSSQSCQKCPQNTATWRRGAKSIRECQRKYETRLPFMHK